MAGRYTEARLYLAGVAVTLLLALWAALAVEDREQQAQAAAPVSVQMETSALNQASSAVPHTRTRAS